MKLKRIGISWDLMRMTFAQGNIIPATKVVSDGIPEDAVICGTHLTDGMLWLDVQSDTFQECEEGKEIPFLIPTFETLQFDYTGRVAELKPCKNTNHIHDWASGADCLDGGTR